MIITLSIRSKAPNFSPHRSISSTKYEPGYWNNKYNQRIFFDDLGKTLNIKSLDDWNHVKLKTVLEHGGYFIKYHYGSLREGL
jgi:hypothetical protein